MCFGLDYQIVEVILFYLSYVWVLNSWKWIRWCEGNILLPLSCGIITVQSNERCKAMENCCYQDEQHNHHLWVWLATLRDTPPPRALMNSNWDLGVWSYGGKARRYCNWNHTIKISHPSSNMVKDFTWWLELGPHQHK